jgi:hypothetical protein
VRLYRIYAKDRQENITTANKGFDRRFRSHLNRYQPLLAIQFWEFLLFHLTDRVHFGMRFSIGKKGSLVQLCAAG